MESLRAMLARLEQLKPEFDAATVLRAQAVIEELFVNSLQHGARGAALPGQEVALAVRRDADSLWLRYEDPFVAFDPFHDLEAVEAGLRRPPGQRGVGGLGRLLAGRLADSARYQRAGDRNRIELRFVPRRNP